MTTASNVSTGPCHSYKRRAPRHRPLKMAFGDATSKEHSQKLKILLITVFYFIIGFISTASFIVLVLLSLPIYAARYILSAFIVPAYFHHKIGKPVTAAGNTFATEFLRNYPPRCVIASNFVMEGIITEEELLDTIRTKWLGTEENGEPTFPELTQYVDRWMGFLFWVKDTKSDPKHHVFSHIIPNEAKQQPNGPELFIDKMMAHLLNQPFAPQRSPWEMHLVHGYRNPRLSSGDMTVILLRFHHALADGYSLMYAVVEKLFGTPLDSIQLPTPVPRCTTSPGKPKTWSHGVNLRKLWFGIKFGFRMIHDVGRFLSLLGRPKTPWHVPDQKKKWKQLYTRSKPIHISQVRRIKKKYNASFTAVLFSAISAGVSKSLQGSKGCSGDAVKVLPTFIPLPLAGHPMKFVNHITGTSLDLPNDTAISPSSRLKLCDTIFEEAKSTALPQLAYIYSKLMGSHLAVVSSWLLRNTIIPMGLSNFPGSASEIFYNGKKGLAGDFAAGAVSGVAGVAFMVMSYRNCVRIAAVAENSVMEQDELNALMDSVCDELKLLDS